MLRVINMEIDARVYNNYPLWGHLSRGYSLSC